MTSSGAVTVLEYRTEFPAGPDRVFAALTDPSHLAHWFCHSAEGDPIPGGRIVMRWTGPAATEFPFEGRWVVFGPPQSCAYEGGHAGYPDGYAGRVGFELAARDGGTVLVTRHRIPSRPDYASVIATYRDAWPRALARLSEYLTPET